MRALTAIFLMFFPSTLKKFLYRKLFGYQIDDGAYIGFSLVLPRALVMRRGARIGSLNVIKGLSEVSMGEHATIGSLNWISGFPEDHHSPHFADQVGRSPSLIIGNHSAITNRHLIDCTDTVTIGRFSTFAGFRSQILTHSISIAESRQRSGPVNIGDYTFVGTASVFLPNSSLPDFSVLGAGSVLSKQYTEAYRLYAGVRRDQ